MDFLKGVVEMGLELVICEDGHGVNGIDGSCTGGILVEQDCKIIIFSFSYFTKSITKSSEEPIYHPKPCSQVAPPQIS